MASCCSRSCPPKISDFSSAHVQTTLEVVEEEVVYELAATTLDMRNATNHSHIILTAAAPVGYKIFNDGPMSCPAHTTLALYRCGARPEGDYPPAALVTTCELDCEFYPAAWLTLTPHLVASGPASVYTAVLRVSFEYGQNRVDVMGDVNLSAVIKTLAV